MSVNFMPTNIDKKHSKQKTFQKQKNQKFSILTMHLADNKHIKKLLTHQKSTESVFERKL